MHPETVLRPRRTRGLRASAIAFSLLVIVGLTASTVPLPTAEARSNVDIKWQSGGVPVIVPLPGYTFIKGDTLIGCAGTAYLTFPLGQKATVMGVAQGPDACQSTNPPCIPYATFSPTIHCELATTYCCQPVYSPGDVTTDIENAQLGCLRVFWLVYDADGNAATPGTPGSDGYEYWLGPFVALGPPNPGSDFDCS